MKNATERCEYCGGSVRESRVTVDCRRGKRLLIIEGVPAGVCRQCGERYYDADVVRKLERIAARRGKAKRKLQVPVVAFDAVA
jgi:YgiT-type zinc finger domain-containing protein